MERERALSRAGAALVAARHARGAGGRRGRRGARAGRATTSRVALRDADALRRRRARRRQRQHAGARHRPRPARGRASVLVAAGPAVADRAVRETLAALGTQVVLAFERAALTEELVRRQSEARFASLVQHSSDLITVLAPDATIAYQSPAIERVLGWTPEEVVGPAHRRAGRRQRQLAPAAADRRRQRGAGRRRRRSSARSPTATATPASSRCCSPT